MANTDISASTVAEISNDVGTTLDEINDLTDQFKNEVISRIEKSWYNKNVTKVMPGAQQALNGVSSGVNSSLSSLGKALANAANTWAEANGKPGYNTRSIAENPRTIAGNYRESGDNGYEGMDPDEIQIAVNKGEEIKGKLNDAITRLQRAGEKEGFRGGSMQSNLNSVCSTLKQQINKAIDTVLDDITTNTGTARSNVLAAKDVTESQFQIK